MLPNEAMFKTLADFAVKTYEDGAIFFTTDRNKFTYINKRILDIPEIAEGESFPTGGFIERCVCLKEEVEGLIARSVYGIRLKVNVFPVFSDTDPEEVVGTCGIFTSRLHPVAKAFEVFAPIVSEIQPEGAWVGITDLQKVAYRYGDKRFDIKEIQVGSPLNEVDVAWAAIYEDRKIVSEINTKEHGVVKIIRLPLKDEETGNIVGTFGVAFTYNLANNLN